MQVSLRPDTLSRIAGAELTRQKAARGCDRKEMEKTLDYLDLVGDRVASAHPRLEKESRLIQKMAREAVAAEKTDCMGEPWPALATGYYQAALEVTAAMGGALDAVTISAAADNLIKGAKDFRPYGNGVYSSDSEKNQHLFEQGLANLKLLNREVNDEEIAGLLGEQAEPEATIAKIAELHKDPVKTDAVSLAERALAKIKERGFDGFGADKTLKEIILAAHKEGVQNPRRAKESRLIGQLAKNTQAESWDLINGGEYLAALEVICALKGSLNRSAMSTAARNLAQGESFLQRYFDTVRNGHSYHGLANLKLLNRELKDPLAGEILEKAERPVAAAFLTLGTLY